MTNTVKTNLNMSFSADDKKVNITLADPKSDLTAETVSTAMDAVVDQGTLLGSNGQPLDGALGAEIETITTQKLF